MSIKINHLKGFLQVLERAKAVASDKNDDIKSGVLIQAKGTSLSIRGMDENISLQIQSNELTEATKETSFLVPASFFQELMKNLPKGDVKLVKKESKNEVNIVVGKSQFNIATMNGEDYPVVDVLQEGNSFKIDGTLFSEGLSAVKHATSENETRPILTGVHIVSNGQYLTLIATDSHRLAAKAVPLLQEATELKNTVLPKKSIDELIQILSNVKECEMIIHENRMTIKTDNLTFTTRLLEGSYPDITKLIPNDFECQSKVNREELIRACDRAKISLKPDKKKVAKFHFKNSELPALDLIFTTSISSGKEELFLADLEGEITINLDVVYLKDSLQSLTTRDVLIQFAGVMKPVLIKPVSEDAAQFALVLPVR